MQKGQAFRCTAAHRKWLPFTFLQGRLCGASGGFRIWD
jgi:hypothetical protein